MTEKAADTTPRLTSAVGGTSWTGQGPGWVDSSRWRGRLRLASLGALRPSDVRLMPRGHTTRYGATWDNGISHHDDATRKLLERIFKDGYASACVLMTRS